MAPVPPIAVNSHGMMATMAAPRDDAGAPVAPRPAGPAPVASLSSLKIRRGPRSPVEAEPADPAPDPYPRVAVRKPAPAAAVAPPAVPPRQPEASASSPSPAPQKPGDITAYWRRLKNGRDFPSWSDLDSRLIADCWPNSMLLRCAADPPRLTLDSLFTKALRVENDGAHGNPAEGINFTPMLTEWILSLGREAERFGKPVQDTDALPSESGEIRYRVIALPLSDDQQRIDHVLCHVDRA